jgi:hypothetical protein
MKKGVYSYEYMSYWGRFWETTLPPIEVFDNQLTDEGISEAEYQHTLKVWETFGCQNLCDYHDLYLKTDVLLLADVFENVRKTCQVQYGFDPAHYYTTPGLSWDALLKKTGMDLELLTDYDMFLFIEKGLRGGVSMVSQRYAKANNLHIYSREDNKTPDVLRCKQSVQLGNVTTISHGWIRLGQHCHRRGDRPPS